MNPAYYMIVQCTVLLYHPSFLYYLHVSLRHHVSPGAFQLNAKEETPHEKTKAISQLILNHLQKHQLLSNHHLPHLTVNMKSIAGAVVEVALRFMVKNVE